MENNHLDLTDLVPEFPEIPQIEISRDALVSRLARSFGPNCRKQVVISDDHYGKTNLLSQFCRRYPSNSIGYFFTSNPLTHNYRNFLYVICNQISKVLGRGSLPVEISENDLKNIYPGLSVHLAVYAKSHDQKFYIVIDGIEEALNSEAGSGILISPPILSKSSHLLLSATLSTYEKLPEQLIKGALQCPFEVALQFNYDDTEKYLSDLDLTTQEIIKINEKSRGVAGYLAILRDSIYTSGKNLIYASELPDNLRKLIINQIDQVFKDVNYSVRESIEILAVAPKPVSLAYLQKYFDEDITVEQLCNTGVIIFDSDQNTLSLKQNLAKQIIQEKIGKKSTEIKRKLLEVVRESSKPDNDLLTLLLEELNDYHGLATLLETDSIRKSFDSGEMGVVIERMRKTSKLALETHEIEEISRWVWGMAAAREYLAHGSTTHEVNALIAVGESQKALKMAYNFPEKLSKIRLLARVYSSMKDGNEHVPLSALEELEVMIDEEEIDKLEKEVVQDIAIDILPILPDKAVSLLEKVIGEPKEQNLIDVAISTVKSTIESSTKNLSDNMVDKRLGQKISLGKLARFQPSWLQGINLANLLKEIDELENTKAKEFMIRQWCLQNTEHDELSFGIELWLDTVIRDENFVISLRSLRKLSELLINIPVKDRRGLIDRFKISAIASLQSPWEEWVGFHLNIAEAINDYDSKYALSRAEEVYTTININIEDFDIKVFCYARLWGTYQKMGLKKNEDIKRNLERVLSNLLENAALQNEILNKTLRILAGIDIDYAIDVADRLNTTNNRKLAKKIVLINGYIKNSPTPLSHQLKRVIKEFDASEQDSLIFDLADELSERNIIIDPESQKLLFYKAREIKSQIDKSITLVNLASIWTNKAVTSASKILSEANNSWENEDDLKKKIIIGFHLVEKIAPFDKEFAQKLCEDVQSTLLFPGAELATGGLGVVYVDSIDLAIRSLGTYNVKEYETLEKIFDQIDKLPTTYLRHQLYAQVAAKIYSLGVFSEAEEVVQDKILNQLGEVTNKNIREQIINFSLPVIFWYSQDIAKELSKEISNSIINRAWVRVILWSLSKGQLGDISNYEIIKVATNSATIRERVIVALRQIKEDVGISIGVDVISQSIEHSVRNNKIDPKSAFDILFEIEEFVENNLPDSNNIKHNGYKIVSLARINGARSIIYKDIKRKGQFSKVDIKSKWGELETMAKGEIKNLADRIFVITCVAEEMHAWDADKAEILLESISDELKKIPSILDRSDRLENVAKTWGIWGQKKQSEFFYSQSIELLNELSPWSQDKKLEHIVQAAYQISPEFADELVERIDSRFPDRIIKPFQLQLKSLIYAQDIEKMISESESNLSRVQGLIIQSSAKRMLNDLVNQNGILPSSERLLEVVYRSSFYESYVVNDVLKWALECENQQQRSYKTNLCDVFLQVSEFTHELARWISPLAQKGISQDIYGYLPGLISKVVVFQPGQRKRAENWVKSWITNNAEGYIKICDPYFGPQELAFISDVRRDIKILIITTDEKFENKGDPRKIQQELLQAWRRVGKGKVPSMTFLIVPASLEKTFHDRAIVSKLNGLDVGPSLNGLGNEMQRITELEYSEAKELEVKYVDDMLNQGKWFINHSVHPEYITIS